MKRAKAPIVSPQSDKETWYTLTPRERQALRVLDRVALLRGLRIAARWPALAKLLSERGH
jgi:hypothetical protein